MRASWANGMQEGYPCQELQRELIGRAATTVGVQFKNVQNHVWPILFGPAGFPSGQEARAYWRPIRDQFSSLVGGGRGRERRGRAAP